ncbi:hypothetical protein KY284_005581 [Solanum tuberosum]|nr:hypothetical protein KY284_005581 [Solanum tuberosum]
MDGSYGRVYKDGIEKKYRFKTLKENVEFIKSFNQNGTQRYKLAINKYVDLTTEKFTASFMGLDTSLLSQQESTATTTSIKYDSVTEVPFSMYWRKRGSVTGIKDQGNKGCKGRLMTVACDFLLQNNGGGITTKTNYPYEEAQKVCKTEQPAGVTISGRKVVTPNESSLLKAVVNQPISIGIAAKGKRLGEIV